MLDKPQPEKLWQKTVGEKPLDKLSLHRLYEEQLKQFSCFRWTEDYGTFIACDQVPMYPKWARFGPASPQLAHDSIGLTLFEGRCYLLRLHREWDGSNWINVGLWRLPAVPSCPISESGVLLSSQRVHQSLLSNTIASLINQLPQLVTEVVVTKEWHFEESGIVFHQVVGGLQGLLETRDLYDYPEFTIGDWVTEDANGSFYLTKLGGRIIHMVGFWKPDSRFVLFEKKISGPNAQASYGGNVMNERNLVYGEDYFEILFELVNSLPTILAGFMSPESREQERMGMPANSGGGTFSSAIDWLRR